MEVSEIFFGTNNNSMIRHSLPPRIFEANLPRLLQEMAELDATVAPVCLDFEHVAYWIPAAIVFVCSMVNCWTARGRKVSFANHKTCCAFSYLRRMDFFDRVGLKLSSHVTRNDPGTSFVEIRELTPGPPRLKDPLARQLAECLAGTTEGTDDVLGFSEYALGEIMNNCYQHAHAPGFVSAQYVANMDFARIGVADRGIGVLESFRSNRSPHYREGMSHADALVLAMEPWVSSRRHLPPGPYGKMPNRGIGLKMVRNMLENSCGELFIASGNAWTHYRANQAPLTGRLSEDTDIPGVVVSLRFKRSEIDNYRQLLKEANTAMDLTPGGEDDRFFA